MMRELSRLLIRALIAIWATTWTATAQDALSPSPWPKKVPVPPLKALDEVEVVGGAPSPDRKIVGIRFKRNGELYVCSGLLISYNRVLTAAHCTCGATDFEVTNGPFAEKSWYRAGFVSAFRAYDCGRQPMGDDLALLDLPFKLPADDSDRTVCATYSLLTSIRLGAKWFPTPPVRIAVAGYGFIGDEPELGNRMEGEVGVNSFLCNGPAARRLGCYAFGELIAGAVRTDGEVRDTCAGDSGGPAFRRLDGTLVPIAIVSRSLPVSQRFPIRGQCGSGGIYTHLGRTDVLQWLRQNGVPEGKPNC